MKVLHLGDSNKFTVPLFQLLAARMDLSGHVLLSRRTNVPWPTELAAHYRLRRGFPWLLDLIRLAREADKIILHGLFNQKTLMLLFLWPALLPKCHWVIWGGDLYRYQSRHKRLGWRLAELYRRPVIRNMGHLLTYVEGDVELARQWYGAKGQYHECLMYPSNTYREVAEVPGTPADTVIDVQVGNSADAGNHHLEVFALLERFKGRDFRVHAPLAYGGKGRYIRQVLEQGRALFGDRFRPMTGFMPLDEYLGFLSAIDIAVFNHRRQQAMGNIVALLARGKKVCLRSEVTSRLTLEKLGVKLYHTEDFDLEPIPREWAESNRHIVTAYFSEQTLLAQLERIFQG